MRGGDLGPGGPPSWPAIGVLFLIALAIGVLFMVRT